MRGPSATAELFVAAPCMAGTHLADALVKLLF